LEYDAPRPFKGVNRPTIIGGMFGLELGRAPAEADLPPILRGPHRLLATARGAFSLLARTLRPGTVWLPSFLCPVVLRSFPGRVRFFGIDESLRPIDGIWLREVERNDLVVFIDYFGFRHWEDQAAEAAGLGAWIVEDASQAFLDPQFSAHTHYVVTSPRKFAGVPDGCVLAARGGAPLPSADLPPPPAAWWQDSLRASVLRGEFDRHNGAREWLDLFQHTEATGPSEPACMSELSALLLQRAVNWPAVARQRRNNYSFLAGALGQLALLPDLPPDVVPLGFPVALDGRDGLRQALFTKQIFPPVHWNLGAAVPREFTVSHRMSARIMTVPCDQRYTPADLERVVRVCSDHGSLSRR
jgi:hypothetical protein